MVKFMLKIYMTDTYEAMSQKAAGIVAANIVLKPNCVLGLATGSSPIGLYRELITKCRSGEVDFSHVKSVNLDEYVGMAPENPQSYHRYMQENLFNHVNIDPANTHIPDGLAENLVDECNRYDRVIYSLGRIDVQVLGIGHNGHIGFNEPAEEFPVNTYVVNLQEGTRQANSRFFASEDEVPRQAVTMGLRSIMQAQQILLVVSGESKAEIVRDAFMGPVTPRLPASILQMHPCVTLVGDQAALSKLCDI